MMPRTKSVAVITALLLASLTLPTAGLADDGAWNLAFLVTVVDTNAEGVESRRSMRVLALDGKRADLSAGWKVPIPTRTTGDGTGEAVTSFSYQDVGFLSGIDGRLMGSETVHASGRIEISSVESDGGDPPTIASFSQRFDVVLQDGQEILLGEAPASRGGSIGLRIAVEIRR